MKMKKDIEKLHEVVTEISYVLTKSQKAKCVILFILILLGSLLDTLGVSMVLPFAQAILNPQELKENAIFFTIAENFQIETNSEIILFVGIVLIIIYIVKNGFLVFAAYIKTALRWNMQRELQTKMLDSYMKRPYTYYLGINSGDVLNGLVNDVNSLYTVVEYFFNFLSYAMTIGMIGVYLCISDLSMAVSILFVSGLCFLVISILFRRLLNGAGQRQRLANAESYKYAYQSINGIKEITVMRRKDFFLSKYDNAIRKSTNENIRFNFLNACPKQIIEAVCICGIIITICIRYISGNVDAMFVSKIAVFIVGAVRILPLVASITNVMNGLVYYWAGVKNTYDNIKNAEEYSEEVKLYIKNKISESKGEENAIRDSNLILNNIQWRYPGTDKNVIDGLNMKIESRHSIAIIGASGAGKTTISDIIMGLYKPQEGTVEFGGIDIFSMPDKWGRMVGYVPQSLFLIDDTIRANITFGIDNTEVDQKKVLDAVERAQLKDYISELPEGLDTIVGEKGIRLSGGQRQRIAIARALYYDPEILVMDEATSALDNETEEAVMEAIDNLQGMKTLIIIAHRLSTIKNCDIVYEIKDGKAVLRDKREVVGE
ncbi:ABC transporter ATP-binding protein [bacterium 1XD21-13]|nr:ABC transporter ATP-binding protein [bacterium 1XD21-13]